MYRYLISGPGTNLLFNANETMIGFKEKGGKVGIEPSKEAYCPDQIKVKYT
jgi:hypothetical protein